MDIEATPESRLAEDAASEERDDHCRTVEERSSRLVDSPKCSFSEETETKSCSSSCWKWFILFIVLGVIAVVVVYLVVRHKDEDKKKSTTEDPNDDVFPNPEDKKKSTTEDPSDDVFPNPEEDERDNMWPQPNCDAFHRDANAFSLLWAKVKVKNEDSLLKVVREERGASIDARMVSGHWYHCMLMELKTGVNPCISEKNREQIVYRFGSDKKAMKTIDQMRRSTEFNKLKVHFDVGFRGIYSFSGKTARTDFPSLGGLSSVELVLRSENKPASVEEILAVRNYDHALYAEMLAFQMCHVAPHLLQIDVDVKDDQDAFVKKKLGDFLTVSVNLFASDLLSKSLLSKLTAAPCSSHSSDIKKKVVVEISGREFAQPGKLGKILQEFGAYTGFGTFSFADGLPVLTGEPLSVVLSDGGAWHHYMAHEPQNSLASEVYTLEDLKAFAAVKIGASALECLAVDREGSFDESRIDMARQLLGGKVERDSDPMLLGCSPLGLRREADAFTTYVDLALWLKELSSLSIPVVLDWPLQRALSKEDSNSAVFGAWPSELSTGPRPGPEFFLCSVLILGRLLSGGEPDLSELRRRYISGMQEYFLTEGNLAKPLNVAEMLRDSELLLRIPGGWPNALEFLDVQSVKVALLAGLEKSGKNASQLQLL